MPRFHVLLRGVEPVTPNITLSKEYFLNATLLQHHEASSILSSIGMMENDTNTLAYLLVSSVTGSISSQLGIGHYRHLSCEAALYSYRIAADYAQSEFHMTGQQPLVERNVLSLYSRSVRSGSRSIQSR